MNKGATFFTVREYTKDREQYENAVKKVKEIGYDSVQHGTPHFMTAAEDKALLDAYGLVPCSAYAGLESMLANPDALKKSIDTAHIYGVKYICVGTLPDELRENAEGYKQFAEQLNKAGKELKKEGLGIMYHNHALEFYSFGGGRHGMDIMVEETDPELVFFNLDTHWLAAGGVNPTDWIYKTKGRLPIIHFKDYAIGGGAQMIEGVCKYFAEVGEGNLDWEAIVSACHATGVEYAVVEQDTCNRCPFESLKISYENMVKFGV
ncbi:MAG: sugar phosphate isomerase/epimerase [Oscillospiraceae bacterium]|nr:sugar phosphate isomerase/epimerase [Oscillospiraceae bacterium]